ncbi:MAG TPA: dolichyl-phosphate beta-glucosyltransferase [Terriglobia bacterium]|nr:dolichyl-phosphate beta-glucosyltransferase [Terriglobia bacterium]
MPQPLLSIVIPAYNEAHRIGDTLEKVLRYCDCGTFPTELIIVDDGSTDSTPELLKEIQGRRPAIRILRNEPNRGKGFSVRRGVLEAQGEFVLFTDADLSAPIDETDKLLAALESLRADAAVGSRAINRQLIGVHQPKFREFSGRFFNLCVRLATGLKIHDTQCGLKLFRRSSTRRAFELQRVDGFGFDPELLFLIERLGGKVVEVPVRWDDNPATKVRFLHDAPRMFFDLVELRWRAVTGKYTTSKP